jgi:hypothetical protein
VIEKKVSAGTAGAVIGGFIVWLLEAYVFGGAVPAPVEALVFFVVPAVAAFIAGYLARHTARPDIGQP